MFRRWLILITAILVPLAMFVGLVIYDRIVTERAAEQQVRMVADTIAEHAETVLTASNVLLDRIEQYIGVEGWDGVGQNRQIHDFLVDLIKDVPQAESAFLVSADGYIAASSRAFPMERFDVREREYYQVVVQGKKTLHINEPFASKMTGKLGFTVSRPAYRHGKLLGIVAITVFPGYFSAFYRTALANPDTTTVSLFRDDGTILVRYPEPTTTPYRLDPSSPLLGLAHSGVERRLMEYDGSQDHKRKLGAYRLLAAQGLFVTYSIDVASFRTPFYVRTGIWALIALAGGVAFFLSARLAVRHAEMERDYAQRLLQETDRRAVLEDRLTHAQRLGAIGQVASGLIHDFNNLLSMIQSTVRMLGRGVSPEKSKELLELANDAVNRGAKLVNQVLTLARPERSGAVIVDIRRVLADMQPLVRHAAGRETKLHMEIDQPVPSVKIDPVQFEVAILNLVVNGRDAMPDGGDLTISITNHASGIAGAQPWNDGVRVAVTDTGIGMDAEVQKRIFEPFFTTKPRDKGNGLGLASVHAFVAQCGGSLEVASEVGRGTTISLLIPPASMISAKAPAA